MKNTNKQILIAVVAILILAGITPSTIGTDLVNGSASAYGGEISSESKTVTIPNQSQDISKDVTTCKPGTHLECNCVNNEQVKLDNSTREAPEIFTPNFDDISNDWSNFPSLPETFPNFDPGFNYVPPNIPTELPKSPGEMFDPEHGGLMGYLGRYFGLVE